ncbi:MAG: STAS/SEC14 domain-containing protein [Burkholderiales bacterium]|nr:STAS/SEC14 domain-containing protein [Bacteroidia bacterium]
MKPPKDVTVLDTETSTYWIEDSGIICSITKKSAFQPMEDYQKSMWEFRKKIGDRKVCLLVDATNAAESNKEIRDYVALELPKFVKALAVLSGSALGKMLANLFFKLKTQPYPIRIFNDELKAREWLKQYI